MTDFAYICRIMLRFVTILLCLSLLAGCTTAPQRIDSTPLPIIRLDRAIADPASITAQQYDSLRPGLEAWRFLNSLSSQNFYPDEDSVLSMFAASRAYQVFAPDVERLFNSDSTVALQLGYVRDHIPGFNYSVYGIISPFSTGVVTVDTVMLIGLNHYLGSDYEGYKGFPQAIRSLKQPERIAYDVAEAALAAQYPYDHAADTEGWLLSRMAYDGALALALLEAVPGADDATVNGWSADQLALADSRFAEYWHTLLGRDMLYSTDPLDVSRMLDPSVTTSVIHPEAPGRLGRYIGMRIGRAWLREHPDSLATALLRPSYYLSPTLLSDASFTP